MSLDNLKTILNAIKYLLTDYPKKKDIPTKLPNPNPLTFTGAVTGSYDGSAPLSVEIPSGGGGGSVPKPLTYDYMPEGYPSKSEQTTTLMEQPEVPFEPTSSGTSYRVILPAPLTFEIVVGKTYTVNWDGTEYECVCVSLAENMYIIGNLSIMNKGDDTGEPFLYTYKNVAHKGQFNTLDTAASHTISVKTTEEIVTPMAEEFIPNIVEIDSIIIKSSTTDSTKKFKITVDDSGTLSATEVTA